MVIVILHKKPISRRTRIIPSYLPGGATVHSHVLTAPLADTSLNCKQHLDRLIPIKEAVHIRKVGRRSMNQDEGSYTLNHTYDRFLATSHHYRGKNRKKNWKTSSDEGL